MALTSNLRGKPSSRIIRKNHLCTEQWVFTGIQAPSSRPTTIGVEPAAYVVYIHLHGAKVRLTHTHLGYLPHRCLVLMLPRELLPLMAISPISRNQILWSRCRCRWQGDVEYLRLSIGLHGKIQHLDPLEPSLVRSYSLSRVMAVTLNRFSAIRSNLFYHPRILSCRWFSLIALLP